ncbi:MAG: cupin domain-containing protein [Anaerolineae bacterium]|nr:cupin domain-containing protein [Anaerolineae bacterium]
MTDDEQLWEPVPVPETQFWGEDGRANINRAPIDHVSGVIYKRSGSIKRVLHQPADPAAHTPADTPARGPHWGAAIPEVSHGDAIVRWLFSEQPGTAEGLLAGRSFRFLQELALAPESATGHCDHVDRDTVLYVIAGCGVLYHRPSTGSPSVARPLRSGDAVLITAGELHSVCNESETEALRLIVLGLSAAKL